MKIIKSYLLLGVASAFLLSGNLLAEEDEGVIGSLFDDVPQADNVKPDLLTSGKKTKSKKEKKKLAAEEIEKRKAAGASRSAERAAKNNQEVDLDTSINDTVVEIPKSDIDNALSALEQAKAALEDTKQKLEDTKQKAEENDEAKKAEIAAEEQKVKDAAELKRLKELTPEDHRRTAEGNVLAEHQAKFATAIVTTAGGAVDVDATATNEANEGQEKQLQEMDIGTDIKAKMANAPAPVEDQSSVDKTAEAVSEDATEITAVEPKAESDAKADDLVPAQESNKEKQKKEKKKFTKEEIDAKKAAGLEKRKARADKRDSADSEEDLDTSLNDKKSRKKLDEAGKKAHEDRMKKQKEDSDAKKSDKKAANEKKKSDQIAAGDKKREERAKLKEENKDKDYTALLNSGDVPAEAE